MKEREERGKGKGEEMKGEGGNGRINLGTGISSLKQDGPVDLDSKFCYASNS